MQKQTHYSSWTLIKRGLRHFRRTHLWVVLGTALGTSILVGALITGDSIRYSLRRLVTDRLGQTEFVLESGERLFQRRLAHALAEKTAKPVASILRVQGIAVAGADQARLNHIQILGVDSGFGRMGSGTDLYDSLSSREAVVNTRLAVKLKIKPGDEILVRAAILQAIPGDAPFAAEDASTARRFKVSAIADEDNFGRFHLQTNQISPYSVFLAHSALAGMLGSQDEANVLLVGNSSENRLDREALQRDLQQIWRLSDAGYTIQPAGINAGQLELRSSRVFLDTAVTRAATELHISAEPVLTYFVNRFRFRERTAPYSFISAPGPSMLPSGMRENEMLINTWLAHDLGAGRGDRVEIEFFVFDDDSGLVEQKAFFTVRDVVELRGHYADPTLLPDFPGLAGEESCRDWHPGMPVDLEQIRPKDEAYWDKYRGTPKAFITLKAAQALWENRFGRETAVRFTGLTETQIDHGLSGRINPASLGFIFREVKASGIRAGAEAVDFAQLFLGLSFFVIAAALMLTGLLYVFNLENRRSETGLFLALGFSPKSIRKLILGEMLVLVTLGSFMGAAGGLAVNHMILFGLKTVWQGAVNTSALRMRAEPLSMITGMISGFILTLIVAWIITGRFLKQPVSNLQRGLRPMRKSRRGTGRMSLWTGVLCTAAFIILMSLTLSFEGLRAAGIYFIEGLLLLAGGIAFIDLLFQRRSGLRRKTPLSGLSLSVRNSMRNRTHSLMLISLLASALFIVFAVGSNRKTSGGYHGLKSGTGGFKLIGEAVLAVQHDLNNKEDRLKLGIDGVFSDSADFVPFRVKAGDDASCLNLNRVSRPRLLGVDWTHFSERGAFTFQKTAREVDPDNPWAILGESGDGVIHGICDQTVIIWGLGKQVGDTLDYVNEKGEPLRIRLMGGLENSVFQGNVLIGEKQFVRQYPSASGYRFFLVDAPAQNVNALSDQLTWALQDYGLDFESASLRLAEYDKVQNTYLSIFFILGTFGLILGSAGIAIIVWRHVNERRGELAALRAIGFNKSAIRRLLLTEHGLLLLAGIITGSLSALIAALPALEGGFTVPWVIIFVLLGFVLINGLLWTWLAVFLATRGSLIPALRNE